MVYKYLDICTKKQIHKNNIKLIKLKFNQIKNKQNNNTLVLLCDRLTVNLEEFEEMNKIHLSLHLYYANNIL